MENDVCKEHGQMMKDVGILQTQNEAQAEDIKEIKEAVEKILKKHDGLVGKIAGIFGLIIALIKVLEHFKVIS